MEREYGGTAGILVTVVTYRPRGIGRIGARRSVYGGHAYGAFKVLAKDGNQRTAEVAFNTCEPPTQMDWWRG